MIRWRHARARRCQYHLLQAIDVDKSARGKQAGQLHLAWQNYLHYTLFHAVLDYQTYPLLLTECERAEQNNRPARGIANTCTSQKMPNVVDNIVSRLQVEAVVRDEDAPSGAAADGGGRKLQEQYERSLPNRADDGRLSFGRDYWMDHANWEFLVSCLSYLLVLQPRCWHIDGTGNDAVLVLHAATADPLPDAARLHFGLEGGTTQAARARMRTCYAQLERDLVDPDERRVLLREGLPSLPSLAKERAAPVYKKRKRQKGSEEEGEGEEEEEGEEEDEAEEEEEG